MSADGASKFQAWSVGSTGFSQPCSINSPKWGGSAADINVQDMQDLSKYQDCMPNFLDFDTSAALRVAYGNSITCPLTKWVIPTATASDTVRSSGGLSNRKDTGMQLSALQVKRHLAIRLHLTSTHWAHDTDTPLGWRQLHE